MLLLGKLIFFFLLSHTLARLIFDSIQLDFHFFFFLSFQFVPCSSQCVRAIQFQLLLLSYAICERIFPRFDIYNIIQTYLFNIFIMINTISKISSHVELATGVRIKFITLFLSILLLLYIFHEKHQIINK